MDVRKISDAELLLGTQRVLGSRRRLTAQLLVCLGEIEARSLFLKEAHPSMYDYCVAGLSMSEGEAHRTLAAARVVRRYPEALPMVEDGRLHCSGLELLRTHLNAANHRTLLEASCGKTKRQIEELIRMHFPRPDVPSRIVPVLEAPGEGGVSQADSWCGGGGDFCGAGAGSHSVALGSRGGANAELEFVTPTCPLGAVRGESSCLAESHGAACAGVRFVGCADPHDAARGASSCAAHAESPGAARARARSSSTRLRPLSATRFHLQCTVSREFRDKLARVQDLMRHSNPRGELEPIFERALDLLVADLEKTRLAKTDRPRRAKQAKHGAISRAARREVFERDGERCTYVAPSGRRCTARAFIQLDHDVARARGGSGEPENLRVRCGAHNRFAAKQLFGEQYVDDKIAARRAQSRAGDRDVHDGEDREVHAAEDRDACAEERRDACGAESRDMHAAQERDTCAEGRGACAAESRDVRGAEDRDACTAKGRQVRAAQERDTCAAGDREACVAESSAAHVREGRAACAAESRAENAVQGRAACAAERSDVHAAEDRHACAVERSDVHAAEDREDTCAAALSAPGAAGDDGSRELATQDATSRRDAFESKRGPGYEGFVATCARNTNDDSLRQRRFMDSSGSSGSSETTWTCLLGENTQAKLVRGLTNMGFRERVARRAVAELAARQLSKSQASARSEHALPALFRAALAVLVP